MIRHSDAISLHVADRLAEARRVVSSPDLYGAATRLDACRTLERGTWRDRQIAVLVKRSVEGARLRRVRGYEQVVDWLAYAVIAAAIVVLTVCAVTLPGNVRADLTHHTTATYSEGSK